MISIGSVDPRLFVTCSHIWVLTHKEDPLLTGWFCPQQQRGSACRCYTTKLSLWLRCDLKSPVVLKDIKMQQSSTQEDKNDTIHFNYEVFHVPPDAALHINFLLAYSPTRLWVAEIVDSQELVISSSQ